MFYCEITKRMSKPGEKCNKIVVQTREKVYKDAQGNEVGRGTEIVKEINATDEGYKLWLAKQVQS